MFFCLCKTHLIIHLEKINKTFLKKKRNSWRKFLKDLYLFFIIFIRRLNGLSYKWILPFETNGSVKFCARREISTRKLSHARARNSRRYIAQFSTRLSRTSEKFVFGFLASRSDIRAGTRAFRSHAACIAAFPRARAAVCAPLKVIVCPLHKAKRQTIRVVATCVKCKFTRIIRTEERIVHLPFVIC